MPRRCRSRPTVTVTGSFEIETSDEVRVLHTLTSWSLDNRIDLVGLTVDRPSLEDVYLELTSAEAAE